MSYLDKLFEGVGMERKALGEIGEFTYGYVAKAQDSGDTRFVRITDIDINGQLITTDMKFVDVSKENKRYLLKKNDILMARTGATYGKTMIFEEDYPAIYAGFLIKLSFDKNIIKPKYYWHFAQSNLFWDQANKLVSGGGQPQFNGNALKYVEVPLPCPENPKKSLEIQQKIVAILDTFTELSAREKQYSYYREELLRFEETEIQHLPMGDDAVGKFIRGGGLQKKDFTDSGVGCIHYGQIYTYYGTYTDMTKTFVSEEFAKKARKAKHGNLVIATTSENDEDVCKAVAWMGEEEIAISNDACIYSHSLNPKYVAYFFQTEQFQKQKRPFITGTKVRRVNADDLAKIKIPVPSPEEQTRIVSILDKFDTLTTSISEGLPKEIALRKRQYEYYRNELLSF